MSDLEFLIAQLVKQIELVWTGTLIGTEAQLVRRRFEFMQSTPEIGDLVLISSVGRNTPAGDRLGWLTLIEDIPRNLDTDAARYVYWTIERLDGSGEIRWTNVQVLRVVEEAFGIYHKIVTPVRQAKALPAPA